MYLCTSDQPWVGWIGVLCARQVEQKFEVLRNPTYPLLNLGIVLSGDEHRPLYRLEARNHIGPAPKLIEDLLHCLQAPIAGTPD